MQSIPKHPKLYHITHVDNLPSILSAGGLLSDAAIMKQGGPETGIGINTIKKRRLRLPVKCHPGDKVGEYVPFYFCPRSIMLYILHRGNLSGLTYQDGQLPILHLEADLHEVIAWANAENRRWAFSLSNAGAVYTEFRCQVEQLDEINWQAVQATDFRNPIIKEGKQAEFLIRGNFPWHLIRRIGVYSKTISQQVTAVLSSWPSSHHPFVEIHRKWYY
jgi:hypothetical protein